ncbi:reverse transcriptase domain-containing protein [Streptomyces sp. NPDC059003]|uniref:reverse transcriptase domain-containing protein n=1 Tax=Streptomyces sp. NPDC059003 TaxID=3346691 RepID=UPI0036C84405
MQSAEALLKIIRERGRKGLPLERLYRCLFNPELYLVAYGRIYRNRGAMTPGSTAETVDGMSLAKIQALIDALRSERYRWSPARRVYIEKKGAPKRRRGLGLPTWSDKLLQEVMRLLLEAYYEPQFSDRSHGFRPGRGCHTALQEIYTGWRGTTWFVKGDIAQCFDRLDHQVLRLILAEKIHDNRFLRLVDGLLQAGYLEQWRYHATLSGSPQGGVISPILSNIYLDRLDKYIEAKLLPAYNRGARRAQNPAYARIAHAIETARRNHRVEEVRQLRKQMQNMPSKDANDPGFRRLRYIRYADDWALGLTGPKQEAEQIKEEVGRFLRDELKLELSEAKTLITHGRTQAARFLGYEIVVLDNDSKYDRRGRRSINAQIGLKVPADVVHAKCRPYLHHGRPARIAGRMVDSDFSIVAQYQAEFRGIAEYYQLAFNRHRLRRLKYAMEVSLAKTLAQKHRTTVPKVYRRYRAMLQTDLGPRKGLRVTAERGDGRPPLAAEWGGISLKRRIKVSRLDDQPRKVWNGDRTELLQWLLADVCELCGSRTNVEVHHVRHLKDLTVKGRPKRSTWARTMAARRRKTLVVCRRCHEDIHAGRLTGGTSRRTALESRVR